MKVSKSQIRVAEVDRRVSEALLDAIGEMPDLSYGEIFQALTMVMVRYSKYLCKSERRKNK